MGSQKRALFLALKEEFKAKGIIPSEDYLRAEVVLKNATGAYPFDLRSTSNTSPIERKLDRNDLFVVTHLGIFLLKEDTTKLGKAVVQSYVNPVEFVDVAAAGGLPAFSHADLEAVYNGNFSLKIASKVNIDGTPMMSFKKVPQTQAAGVIQSQFNIEQMSHELPNLLRLSGNMDIQPKVEYTPFEGINLQHQTANTNNKLVFLALGFLLKGAAV